MQRILSRRQRVHALPALPEAVVNEVDLPAAGLKLLPVLDLSGIFDWSLILIIGNWGTGALGSAHSWRLSVEEGRPGRILYFAQKRVETLKVLYQKKKKKKKK